MFSFVLLQIGIITEFNYALSSSRVILHIPAIGFLIKERMYLVFILFKNGNNDFLTQMLFSC